MLVKTTITLLLFVLSISGQKPILYHVVPDWQIGDSKIVTTNTEIKLFANDTIVSKDSLTKKFILTIVDTSITYTVDFQFINNESSSDIIKTTDIKAHIESSSLQLINSFNYRVQVKRRTGYLIGVSNESEVINKLYDNIFGILKSESKEGSTKKEIDNVVELFTPIYNSYIKLKIAEVETELERVLESYDYNVPMNDVFIDSNNVTDSEANFEHFGTNKITQIISLESSRNEDQLLINTSTMLNNDLLPNHDRVFNLDSYAELGFDIKGYWVNEYNKMEIFNTYKLQRIVTRRIILK
ncbi:MAG: hypothetical protein ACI8Q1_002886 [Parvicella sp.]|jgi:hypothetical protein